MKHAMFTAAKPYLYDICFKYGEDTFLTPRRKSALLSKDPKYFKGPYSLDYVWAWPNNQKLCKSWANIYTLDKVSHISWVLPVFSQVFQHVTEIDKEQKYDQASLISITIQHQPKKKRINWKE